MKPQLTILLLACLGTGCSKKEKEKEKDGDVSRLTWLDPIIKSYDPCMCKTNIYYGIYEEKTVYEVRGVDPLCKSINMIYADNGKKLFHSGNREKYRDYRRKVKDEQLIWNCDKAAGY